MRLSLILALIIAIPALAGLMVEGALVWFAGQQGLPDAGLARLMIGAGAGMMLILLLAAVAWVILHSRLAMPLASLAREAETLAHSSAERALSLPEGHLLGGVPGAVEAVLAALRASKAEIAETISRATATTEAQRGRLEAILRDLSEGVIVASLEHRIQLYNQSAVHILGAPDTLGLGRRVFAVLDPEPIVQALDSLRAAAAEGAANAIHPFECRLSESGERLPARLGLMRSADGEIVGYVISFSDAKAEPGTLTTRDTLPPRPEFYDFDIFHAQGQEELFAQDLKRLRYVVFDSETTGLRPSAGDELLAIGAVRVVNGRVITGETFERLINPGRPIPASSIRFHGITEDMVRDAPPAHLVLPQFHAFVGQAVLVAHNAAFDMKFLEKNEAEAGVHFDNPVLDVLLLSAFLHDHTADHSLNATADRFGVHIVNRHTALGDAMLTAAIFVRMLDLLAARGVRTLGEAVEVSSQMVAIRKQQAQF